MQATMKTPKSILKKPSAQRNNDERTLEQMKADRHLEVALYHANIIQKRKNVELEILLSTEKLLDSPSSPEPSAHDIALFKKLIRPFQPADYDCLIEERNICKKCGYALCARPNRRDNGKGGLRILGNGRGKANEFKVITKAEAEKWCSEECARRALYIRVQLNEQPAWERIAVQDDVGLRGEEELDAAFKEDIADILSKLNLDNEGDDGSKAGALSMGKNAADLALERGEGGAASTMSNMSLANITIREKEVTSADAPSVDEIDGEFENLHITLEGHIPQFKGSLRRLNIEDTDMN